LPSIAHPPRHDLRNLILYLVCFFLVWSLRATLLYPIDNHIQSEVARQIYGSAVRIALWVVPVLVYLRAVDRTAALRFLKLTTPVDRRGLMVSVGVVACYFGVGLLLEWAAAGGHKTVSFKPGPWPWHGVLIGLPLAPAAEEILFRGFILEKCRGLTGFWRANLVTSLLFTAIHWPHWVCSQGLHAGLVPLSAKIFLVSCLLGYLVKRTGSLWPSIVTHILNNLISTTIRFG
jgi:uncharacterized protein